MLSCYQPCPLAVPYLLLLLVPNLHTNVTVSIAINVHECMWSVYWARASCTCNDADYSLARSTVT